MLGSACKHTNCACLLPSTYYYSHSVAADPVSQPASSKHSVTPIPRCLCCRCYSHDPGLQPDCILVNEAQRHNLRMAEGELYAFR